MCCDPTGTVSFAHGEEHELLRPQRARNNGSDAPLTSYC
jgi:hypothetical protein